MDPNTTLRDLLAAIVDGDLERAHEKATDLYHWRRNGGFAPAPYTLSDGEIEFLIANWAVKPRSRPVDQDPNC